MPRDAAAALKGFKKWPGVRIEHGRGPVNARRNLLKQLQPFAPIENSKVRNPVMLPPGRERLATKPEPIGSETFTKRMGMVRVCFCRAAVVGVFCVRMRSG
jgi:hypothetical protein